LPGAGDPGYLVKTVLWIGSLCVLGGLEGYFAAKKNLQPLVIGIFFGLVWIGIF
jgi:hypothetical protein